uniref:undecaprenyl-diphosphate phosphatase n=1 Tax=Ndongobacter massiliensis TaxID=1871025 RepID=UPI000931F3B6|nr:undecaprenyl-diphosphate phosphatase [Ndongobacter massiliensis]
MDLFKVIILSIIEGITEFLPVSSTGHLIIANAFLKLEPAHFANVFNIVIQLGAILSVVVVFFHRLNPFSIRKIPPQRRPANYEKWNRQTRAYYCFKHADPATLRLWAKVLVGILPAFVLGFLLDDFIDAHLMTTSVVVVTLLLYGVLMIAVENWNARRQHVLWETADAIDYKTAFLIGCFQCLALIPGTSRSAATIIGAMLLGTSRAAAAEFSFFLAIPVMGGATLLKVMKNFGGLTLGQWTLILIGTVLSFLVAYVVIRKFMAYVQKHDFKVFGYYRIVLALILLIMMLFQRA